MAKRTRDILKQICVKHEVQIVLRKVTADHVRVFVSYRPQLAFGKLVQYLKDGSSRILLQEYVSLRKQFLEKY